MASVRNNRALPIGRPKRGQIVIEGRTTEGEA